MDAQAIQGEPPPGARYVAGGVAGAILIALGIGMVATDSDVGFAVLCAGMIALVWSMASLEHVRTLSRLSGVSLGDMALPLPVLPAVSDHPHRDVALMPADVPAVVPLPDGRWGLVPRDTAEAAASRVGFNGRWHTVAQPMVVHDPATPVSAVGRIPRDGAAVLVDAGRPTPSGVTGTAIRRRAEDGAAR